jgi:DNA-binding NarL/FixJ family response regulator
MGECIRVSIVDDDSVVRSSLRLMIDRLPRYQVVSSHGSADDALSVLPGISPDVVLLDIRMPGLSGIECARLLRQSLPELRIVMVTAHLDDNLIADAFRFGAVGYVTKPFEPKTIADALEHARQGSIHVEGQVSERFLAWMRGRRGGAVPLLSEREVEVLQFVREGLSDKEIAVRLGLSEATVKSHLRSILAKLKVTSRSGAVAAYFGGY